MLYAFLLGYLQFFPHQVLFTKGCEWKDGKHGRPLDLTRLNRILEDECSGSLWNPSWIWDVVRAGQGGDSITNRGEVLRMWTASREFCLSESEWRIYQRGVWRPRAFCSRLPSSGSFYVQLAAQQRLQTSSNPHNALFRSFSHCAQTEDSHKHEDEEKMQGGEDWKHNKVAREQFSVPLTSTTLHLKSTFALFLFPTRLTCAIKTYFWLSLILYITSYCIFPLHPTSIVGRQWPTLDPTLMGVGTRSIFDSFLSILSGRWDRGFFWGGGGGGVSVSYRQQVAPGWKVMDAVPCSAGRSRLRGWCEIMWWIVLWRKGPGIEMWAGTNRIGFDSLDSLSSSWLEFHSTSPRASHF